jgi:hypothetical protein
VGDWKLASLGPGVTYRKDESLVRTGNAPRVMASLRGLAISRGRGGSPGSRRGRRT